MSAPAEIEPYGYVNGNQTFKIKRRMKIAFVSETFPPSKTGQGMVLHRLLKEFSPEDYCLISPFKWDADNPDERQPTQLPGRYYQIPHYFTSDRSSYYRLSNLREDAAIPFGILARARQVAEIVRREKCDAIVGCTGDVLDLPASYLASRRLKLPLYAYIFDHYTYREWYNPARRFWANRLAPRIMRNASGVIVPNEVLRDDMRQLYGIEATVIHNSFDVAQYAIPIDEAQETSEGEIKIVYTGDIYEAHYDAFHNLMAGIERLGRTDVKLHLYTPWTVEQLAEKNIRGPIVCHEYHSQSEISRIQRQADLLFLPLAFDSPYPDLIRTSSTTKLGEYLGARRPVLAHAPPDSFVAWYCRKYQCGVVVDHADPEAMTQAIKQVLDDKALQQELGKRAWERAKIDFDIEATRVKFLELVERGAKDFASRRN